jgi:hypothetical protein
MARIAVIASRLQAVQVSVSPVSVSQVSQAQTSQPKPSPSPSLAIQVRQSKSRSSECLLGQDPTQKAGSAVGRSCAQTPKQNIPITGEFQSCQPCCRSAPARAARPVIRFRKSSSAMCGPQGPHPGRPGCPARPPRHLKEWCNMALYARGQRAATSGCRPAPAGLRWY